MRVAIAPNRSRSLTRWPARDFSAFAIIADLVVAITMGAMTSPGRPHMLAFVMIPTFAVPLALMLHGLVLWRLRREPASNGRLAAA